MCLRLACIAWHAEPASAAGAAAVGVASVVAGLDPALGRSLLAFCGYSESAVGEVLAAAAAPLRAST